MWIMLMQTTASNGPAGQVEGAVTSRPTGSARFFTAPRPPPTIALRNQVDHLRCQTNSSHGDLRHVPHGPAAALVDQGLGRARTVAGDGGRSRSGPRRDPGPCRGLAHQPLGPGPAVG